MKRILVLYYSMYGHIESMAQAAAEEVGKAEGDEKGVGDRSGAESRSNQDIAQKAEEAAYRSQRSDSCKAAQKHGGTSVALATRVARSPR